MTDFAATRAAFHLPEGVTYLDGNSLGPMPVRAAERVAAMMRDEWAEMLITGWNRAGWYVQPRRVGDRIARLIGAGPSEVVMGDTLSIKVFQALSAALTLNPVSRGGLFCSNLGADLQRLSLRENPLLTLPLARRAGPACQPASSNPTRSPASRGLRAMIVRVSVGMLVKVHLKSRSARARTARRACSH